MPLMSLIGCKVFEDEFIHLLENDPDIDRVIVIDSEDSESFAKKLNEINYPYEMCHSEGISHVVKNSKNSEYIAVIYIMEFAYDAKPEVLKEEVYKQIDIMKEYSDGILIFYGLCGNVLGNVEQDFESVPCAVRILKDEHGDVVDDCICATLGGKKQYMDTLRRFKGKGIYFLTPVQASYWREMLKIARVTPDPDDIEMTKLVFDYSGYENVGKICTGLSYEKDYDQKIEEFASLFDFDIVELEGDLRLIENCYFELKNEILDHKS
ncbi:Protein of unknown function DUF1638 [Methanosalsum zhilinae DSM 4017]|uniref:DUF1638 domain-containing protein n=1 Tax=Methanosalsum zhilinae (strain DSM 4017 / NBRC 107636 / OCM 62 / WeN5) TaxID=679901 RepID=F7XPR1_METZD|nr:DUF1638 domain-containing protein [Methanosalsum zhilinae]AEH60331.1 Protein of unknown function DUF1638 [Methanosalsum zhilinae DSM 4017]